MIDGRISVKTHIPNPFYITCPGCGAQVQCDTHPETNSYYAVATDATRVVSNGRIIYAPHTESCHPVFGITIQIAHMLEKDPDNKDSNQFIYTKATEPISKFQENVNKEYTYQQTKRAMEEF